MKDLINQIPTRFTPFTNLFSSGDRLLIQIPPDDDALCFYDLGSSEMNIDLAIDMYKGKYHIYKVNAPIVEGSFTAAMSLSVGKTANEAIQEVNRSSFKSTAFK